MPRKFTAAERVAIKAAAPSESHNVWDKVLDLGIDPRDPRVTRQPSGLDVDLGGGQHAVVRGRLKHLADGTPIDTDLHAGPPGFLAAGKASLGYGFRLGGNGGYEVSSGGVTTVIGAPEYWAGSQWRVLPLTQREIIQNRAEWDTPQGLFRVFILPHLVGCEIHLTGPEQATGWRFSIGETGGNVKLRDGSWSAKGATGTVPVHVADGFVVYDAPDLTGVTGPVEMRL